MDKIRDFMGVPEEEYEEEEMPIINKNERYDQDHEESAASKRSKVLNIHSNHTVTGSSCQARAF